MSRVIGARECWHFKAEVVDLSQVVNCQEFTHDVNVGVLVNHISASIIIDLIMRQDIRY